MHAATSASSMLDARLEGRSALSRRLSQVPCACTAARARWYPLWHGGESSACVVGGGRGPPCAASPGWAARGRSCASRSLTSRWAPESAAAPASPAPAGCSWGRFRRMNSAHRQRGQQAAPASPAPAGSSCWGRPGTTAAALPGPRRQAPPFPTPCPSCRGQPTCRRHAGLPVLRCPKPRPQATWHGASPWMHRHPAQDVAGGLSRLNTAIMTCYILPGRRAAAEPLPARTAGAAALRRARSAGIVRATIVLLQYTGCRGGGSPPTAAAGNADWGSTLRLPLTGGTASGAKSRKQQPHKHTQHQAWQNWVQTSDVFTVPPPAASQSAPPPPCGCLGCSRSTAWRSTSWRAGCAPGPARP